jgi:hypothetical protein
MGLMKIFTNTNRLFIKTLIQIFLLLLLFSNLYSQHIFKAQIQPYLSSDSLKVKIHLDIWSFEDSKKAFLSGLPMVLDLSISLKGSDDRSLANLTISPYLKYDIWSESYSITGLFGKIIRFSSWTDFNSWFLPEVKLLSFSELPKDEVLKIELEGRLLIQSGKGEKGFTQWLQNGEQTEEDLPSHERSTGFKLNLNKIIQLLVANSEKPQEYPIRSNSKQFTIGELIVQ